MFLSFGFLLACSPSAPPSETVPGPTLRSPTKTAAPSEAVIAKASSSKKEDAGKGDSIAQTYWHPAKFKAHPLYLERKLTESDLKNRTLRELSLMRNMIFARVGNTFVKPWLNDYFRQFEWYVPQQAIAFHRLSPFDRDNAAFIAKYEASFTHDDLSQMRESLFAKKAEHKMRSEDERELHLIAARLGEWSGDAEMPLQDRNPLEDPNALQFQLKTTQLDKMSRRDLRLLRNTIFARYGRSFKSDLLTHHFWSMKWYKPNSNYSDALLSDIDKRNIQLIQSMENKLGGALTDDDHAHEIGWYGGA